MSKQKNKISAEIRHYRYYQQKEISYYQKSKLISKDQVCIFKGMVVGWWMVLNDIGCFGINFICSGVMEC